MFMQIVNRVYLKNGFGVLSCKLSWNVEWYDQWTKMQCVHAIVVTIATTNASTTAYIMTGIKAKRFNTKTSGNIEWEVEKIKTHYVQTGRGLINNILGTA